MKSFEELKNSWVWIGSSPKLSELVQKRLFELGFRWNYEDNSIRYTDKFCLLTHGEEGIKFSDQKTLEGVSKSGWVKDFKEVTIADIGIEFWIWVGGGSKDSEETQKRLFEMGYSWLKSGNSIKKHEITSIGVNSLGQMHYIAQSASREAQKAAYGLLTELRLCDLDLPVKEPEPCKGVKTVAKEEATSIFKVGDIVFLPSYGKHEDERDDWAEKEGIPLNRPLKVSSIQDVTPGNPGFRFEGRKYVHPQRKFRPISELEWSVPYSPEVDRYLICKYGQIHPWIAKGVNKGITIFSEGFFSEHPRYASEVSKVDGFNQLSHDEFRLISNFLYPIDTRSAPVPQVKANWRFKTEEEFAEEFGENWKYVVEFSWLEDMDRLFGMGFSKGPTSENGTVTANIMGTNKPITMFNVSEDMVTNRPLPTTIGRIDAIDLKKYITGTEEELDRQGAMVEFKPASAWQSAWGEDMDIINKWLGYPSGEEIRKKREEAAELDKRIISLYTQTETLSTPHLDSIKGIDPYQKEETDEMGILAHMRGEPELIIYDTRTGYPINFSGRTKDYEEVSLISSIFERPNILTITE